VCLQSLNRGEIRLLSSFGQERVALRLASLG